MHGEVHYLVMLFQYYFLHTIKVLPSFVLSKMLARNLSANSSMMLACPFSAAKCIGVRSLAVNNILFIFNKVFN